MKTSQIRKVVVLYNKPVISELGNNVEAELDTWHSAEGVAKGLEGAGYEVELVGVDENSLEMIKQIEADVVFNLIEWTGKETIYATKAIDLLEKLGVPFTGSDAKGFLLSADKIRMKKMFGKLKIRTPKYQLFRTGKEKLRKDMRWPVIVKPVYEHCGIGVSQKSVVRSAKEVRARVKENLEAFGQPVLVEEYIDGKELHVTILEKRGKAWILPPAEVKFAQAEGVLPIMTYAMKWDDQSIEFTGAPVMDVPKLKSKVMLELRQIAQKCYERMGARDYARFDVRLAGDVPYVLELNNNPGIDFLPQSGIGASAAEAGFSFETLLAHIVENAAARFVGGRYKAWGVRE